VFDASLSFTMTHQTVESW